MAKYNIYCKQNEYYIKKGATEKEVKDFAFGIIKDRSEHIDDEYAQELKKEVQKGRDNFSFQRANKVLEEWEYRLDTV